MVSGHSVTVQSPREPESSAGPGAFVCFFKSFAVKATPPPPPSITRAHGQCPGSAHLILAAGIEGPRRVPAAGLLSEPTGAEGCPGPKVRVLRGARLQSRRAGKQLGRGRPSRQGVGLVGCALVGCSVVGGARGCRTQSRPHPQEVLSGAGGGTLMLDFARVPGEGGLGIGGSRVLGGGAGAQARPGGEVRRQGPR